MSSKDEFLQYMGATGGAIALLFVLQAGMRSCIDVSYNAKKDDAAANPELVSLRKAEAEALEEAGIERAMAAVAKNRQAGPVIAPRPSDDLSAMSGWVQATDYAPYEPEQLPAPAPAGESAPPTEGSAPAPAGEGN